MTRKRIATLALVLVSAISTRYGTAFGAAAENREMNGDTAWIR